MNSGSSGVYQLDYILQDKAYGNSYSQCSCGCSGISNRSVRYDWIER